jgi:hypothetical protein
MERSHKHTDSLFPQAVPTERALLPGRLSTNQNKQSGQATKPKAVKWSMSGAIQVLAQAGRRPLEGQESLEAGWANVDA